MIEKGDLVRFSNGYIKSERRWRRIGIGNSNPLPGRPRPESEVYRVEDIDYEKVMCTWWVKKNEWNKDLPRNRRKKFYFTKVLVLDRPCRGDGSNKAHFMAGCEDVRIVRKSLLKV